MKYAPLVLAAAIIVTGVASWYHFVPRNADDVQQVAVRLNEWPGDHSRQMEQCTRELQRWNPDDLVGALLTYFPVIILAIGLVIALFLLSGEQDTVRNLRELWGGFHAGLLFAGLAVAGVIAVAAGQAAREEAFRKADRLFAEWAQMGKDSSSWVTMKDAFLANLLLVKKYTVILYVGLIGAGLGLLYFTVAAAQRRQPTESRPPAR